MLRKPVFFLVLVSITALSPMALADYDDVKFTNYENLCKRTELRPKDWWNPWSMKINMCVESVSTNKFVGSLVKTDGSRYQLTVWKDSRNIEVKRQVGGMISGPVKPATSPTINLGLSNAFPASFAKDFPVYDYYKRIVGYVVSNHGGSIVSNNGGSIVTNGGNNIIAGNTGRIVMVDLNGKIISNNGGTFYSKSGAVLGLGVNTVITFVSKQNATSLAKLVSNNGANIISNNGGSIISNNGGSIISNNGGSIISNNGGSIISNNGGSIVSNNSGSAVSGSRGLLSVNNSGSGSTFSINTLQGGRRCIDIPGGNRSAGTAAALWDCHGGENQKFTYDSKTRELKVFGNMCLDAMDKGRDGVRLGIWSCHGGANQKWSFTSSNQLVTGTGKCLEVQDRDYRNGARLILNACRGTNSYQMFTKK